MIRLNPTEITLTPADIEETRQRMERRRVTNPPTAPSAQVHYRRPPGARIRRGAQRSRDDAVAVHLPVLQPQEAVLDFLDDDDDQPLSSGSSNKSSDSSGVDTSTSPLPADQVPSVGTMQLPFRPAPRASASEDTTYVVLIHNVTHSLTSVDID
jgi:hypothetical protein